MSLIQGSELENADCSLNRSPSQTHRAPGRGQGQLGWEPPPSPVLHTSSAADRARWLGLPERSQVGSKSPLLSCVMLVLEIHLQRCLLAHRTREELWSLNGESGGEHGPACSSLGPGRRAHHQPGAAQSRCGGACPGPAHGTPMAGPRGALHKHADFTSPRAGPPGVGSA